MTLHCCYCDGDVFLNNPEDAPDTFTCPSCFKHIRLRGNSLDGYFIGEASHVSDLDALAVAVVEQFCRVPS